MRIGQQYLTLLQQQEGKWENGAKMYFSGTNNNGKRGGMVLELVEINSEKQLSIGHYGILDGEIEIT